MIYRIPIDSNRWMPAWRARALSHTHFFDARRIFGFSSPVRVISALALVLSSHVNELILNAPVPRCLDASPAESRLTSYARR